MKAASIRIMRHLHRNLPLKLGSVKQAGFSEAALKSLRLHGYVSHRSDLSLYLTHKGRVFISRPDSEIVKDMKKGK